MSDDQLRPLRCRTCGDTFTVHAGDEERCPSCGGAEVEAAWEPLL